MQERRKMILQKLEEYGSVKVNVLSSEFRCSEVTIRADIRALEQEGKLTRTHGGAVRREEEDSVIHYRAESLYRNVELKKQIAACAYEFIEDRDTIIIDDASTSFYLAVYIKAHPEKHLAIVTNSLLAANELAGLSHIELFMVGGHVGGHLAATMGEIAEESMAKFHVDKAFIGVHSINFDAGLTSIATPQMQVKQSIMKTTDKVFVLADSTKFGGGYLSVICPIKSVYKIITDQKVSKQNIIRAERESVPLVIAGKTE